MTILMLWEVKINKETIMKNKYGHGFDEAREIREQEDTDYIFGSNTELKGIAEGVDLKPYLPKGEVQRGVEDFMDCASRGPNNILEAKLNYLVRNSLLSDKVHKFLSENGYITKDGSVELSDRYTAILSKTSRKGNSLKAPIHAIHKKGIIPKQMLPAEKWMKWSDYHKRSSITYKMKELGKRSTDFFTTNYERVGVGDFINIKDMIDVAVHAWSQPRNGVYPRTHLNYNHVVARLQNEPIHQVFDNYIDRVDGDFIKQLARDYSFLYYGYHITINADVNPKKKDMEKSKLEKYYKLGFHRPLDNGAMPHLDHPEEAVLEAMTNSKEWEKVDAILNWAKGKKVWNIWDLRQLGGLIKEYKEELK